MVKMQRDLDARRDEFGLLASSAWLSAEQASGNGNVAIMYFRDYACVPPPSSVAAFAGTVRGTGRTDGRTRGLHRFAHSDLHRAAWRMWAGLAPTHQHLHIWHELFDAPPGRWESVHINAPPNMLAAAALPRPCPGDDGEKDGREVRWESVAVDATRGG